MNTAILLISTIVPAFIAAWNLYHGVLETFSESRDNSKAALNFAACLFLSLFMVGTAVLH